MKALSVILKLLAAAAAVAGIVYVIATYGDKIVAWAKNLLGGCGCDGDCACPCEDDCENCNCEGDCDTCECDCCEEVVEELNVADVVVEEPVAEEPAAEQTPADEPAAEEADFVEE